MSHQMEETDIDSDGMFYQTDVDYDNTGAFAPDDDDEYIHFQYPDENEEPIHPWGTSEHLPSECAAAEYAKSLLNSPDMIFKDVLRLTKIKSSAFFSWLKANTAFDDNQRRTCEQSLMIFLYIMGFGETQRNTAYRFQMSQPSVCRIFHNVLSYMSQLHKAFVQMPTDDYISDKISTEFRYLAFNGCIGAIDGTHIAIAKRGHLS
ncbi:hypothetical protein E4U26_005520 [Claviceps purpurea]|nr:hypothetical protein E4U26_005520 [Claviceps purpurea]